MKKYKYLLFDLDGTLTDSSEGILNCFIHALECMGKPVPERSELMKLIGPPLDVNFRELLGFSEEETQQGIKKYRERYSSVGWSENRPYDGIEELLKRLKAAGYTLAVATSKPEKFSVKILEYFSLAGYFETICGSGLDGTRDTKAEVIEETLARLGADKADAVMIGDRKYDIIGARQAGLECIGAEWGFPQPGELKEFGALFTAKTPAELGDKLINES